MEKISTNNRLDYIDILKSLGIIVMVMGHVGYGGWFDYYIHSFHMPMFFLISGFLYKSKTDKSLKELSKKNFRTLLIPYIVFGFGYLSIYIGGQFICDLLNINITFPIMENTLHLIWVNTDKLPIGGALWFLTAMLFVNIIYYLLDKYFSDICRILMVVLLFIIGIYWTDLTMFRLPYAIDSALVGVGLYEIGRQFKAYANINNLCIKTNIISCFIIFIISFGLVFVNGYVNMRCVTYGNALLFLINACAITYALLIFSQILGIYLSKNIVRKLSFIGANSMVYICMNQFMIMCVTKIMNGLIPTSFIVIIKLMILFITMILLKYISLFINKSKIRWIVGK